MNSEQIVPFCDETHRAGMIALWLAVFGYEAAHNEPNLVIDQKLAHHDGLFFAAVVDGQVAGSVMAGYDGHRGWLYSLAVSPDHRHHGLGSRLVQTAELALTQRGCLKINLQIVAGNEAVQAFYQTLGYAAEARISMGKRLPMPEDNAL